MRPPSLDSRPPMPASAASRRRRALCLLCLLPVAGMLAACGPGLYIGAGAMAGNAAMQERGFTKTVGDTATEAKISAALLDHSGSLFVDVSAEVYEGRALLTGDVETAEDRIEAVRRTWNVSGVTEVINEIQIEDDSDLLDAARDQWISAQLSTKITLDKKIKGLNYSIETVNGTVYVMGIAQNKAEIDRVRDHARQLPYVRRVISYVRIKDAAKSGA